MAKKYNSIEEASQAYFEAKAQGDADGMQAANDAANEIRISQGEAPQYATGDISGVRNSSKTNATAGNGSTGAGNSVVSSASAALKGAQSAAGSYSPKSSYYDDDASTLMSSADQALLQRYKDQFAEAASAGNEDLANQMHEAANALREKYGYTSAYSDGTGYMGLGVEENPVIWGVSSPNYTPEYDGMMDSVLDKIVNRDPFTYNYLEDPLYQQYFDMYTREGSRAMQDTLGQVSARTGGLASSYAGSAAQQTYNNYMSALADKIPELQQLAYEMYLNEGEENYNQLSAIQGMDAIKYNRFADDLGQWNTDRDFNYNAWRDQLSDAIYQDETDYNRSTYESETEYSRALEKAQTLAAAGDFSGYKALGYSDAEISNLKTAYDRSQAVALLSSSSSSSSSGSSGSKSGGSSGSTDYNGLFRAALESGYPKSFIANNYKQYGFTSSSGLYDEYQDWEPDEETGGGDVATDTLSSGAKQILNNLETMRGTSGSGENIGNTIAVYCENGKLTDAEARYLFAYFGYDPDDWLE